MAAPFHARVLGRILRPFGYRMVLSNNGMLFAKDALTRAIYELCNRADEGGIESLAPRQKTVVLAWAARGIIGNGGFRCLYEGSWHMHEVAKAFRALGFAAAADACESSLAIFAGGLPPQDHQRRREIVSGADFSAYDDRESIVYEVTFDALKAAIGAYIEQHPADFETVLPNAS